MGYNSGQYRTLEDLHSDLIQVHQEDDAVVVNADGNEIRLPGGRVDVSFQDGGPLSVYLSAQMTASRIEFGGAHGS